MLRSRFQSVPLAFSERFWTGRNRKNIQEESVLHFIFQHAVLIHDETIWPQTLEIYWEILQIEFLWQDDAYERDNIAYFSQVWNEFINSMREEDLISNRFKSNLHLSRHIVLHMFEFQAYNYIT